jgi:hypothetical protein
MLHATYAILLMKLTNHIKSYKLNILYDNTLNIFTVKGINMSIYIMKYIRMSITKACLEVTVFPWHFVWQSNPAVLKMKPNVAASF